MKLITDTKLYDRCGLNIGVTADDNKDVSHHTKTGN